MVVMGVLVPVCVFGFGHGFYSRRIGRSRSNCGGGIVRYGLRITQMEGFKDVCCQTVGGESVSSSDGKQQLKENLGFSNHIADHHISGSGKFSMSVFCNKIDSLDR